MSDSAGQALADDTVVVRIEAINVGGVDVRLLQFFDHEGIRPGVQIQMVSVGPSLGSLTAQIGARSVIMGVATAARIWVV